MALINGTANSDDLAGGAESDLILGFEGNDALDGGGGNDNLIGGEGNDILIGGVGNDALRGSSGDDKYVIGAGDAGDFIVEFLNNGIDTVFSSIDFTLPGDVEKLILQGSGNINGTGNPFKDDEIVGNTGNNILNGLSGNDRLEGGKGDDTYVVDSSSDIVVENVDSGIDTVQSSVSFFLTSAGTKAVENVTLTGIGNLASTGNALDNVITGNSGNNVINGSDGNDTLKTLGGNDSLFGGNGNDVMDGGSGIDSLFVSGSGSGINANLTLTNTSLNGEGTDSLAGIEIVQLTGGSADNIFDAKAATTFSKVTLSGGDGNDTLLGGGGVNVLAGGNGNDHLNGGGGNDSLLGGVGLDKFVYNTGAAFKASAVGIDVIQDFNITFDRIVLDKTTFTKISSNAGNGFSQANEFAVVTSDAAAASSAADIVYNSTKGSLFYNQNGTASGFGTGAQFATLGTNVHPILSVAAFQIQA